MIITLYIIIVFEALFMKDKIIDNEIVLMKKKSFESIINNKKTKIFTLKNKDGMTVEITNYGARVVSIWVKDKYGNFDDVVLGCNNIQDYIEAEEKYLGATIGRYANRIKNAKFSINENSYLLTVNNNTNHLHGGNKGFHNVVWNVISHKYNKLELAYFSKDMEEGYPGNLKVKVIYTVNDANELKINYEATSDKKTHVNLTHHSYFNLSGSDRINIEQHKLMINSNYYIPVDKNLIPTGNVQSVKDSPFDFKYYKTIGKEINVKHPQIKLGGGYDHNFIIDKKTNYDLAARVYEEKSGRIMEVFTNQPGIQFYSGNFLNGKTKGKNNTFMEYRSAFCLETQHFPDSPNNEQFPSTLLNPKETYKATCSYRFSY